MPLVYADTSALFAFFHPKDEFAGVVSDAVRRHSPDFVYWIDGFWTCDEEQSKATKAAGLQLRLFALS